MPPPPKPPPPMPPPPPLPPNPAPCAAGNVCATSSATTASVVRMTVPLCSSESGVQSLRRSGVPPCWGQYEHYKRVGYRSQGKCHETKGANCPHGGKPRSLGITGR